VTARATLLAVPNISEGRDERLVAHIAGTDALLDISSDPDHSRSVLTFGGEPELVVDTCVAMIARAVTALDIRIHDGVHPRFGVVDVLPFVPYGVAEEVAVRAAHDIAWRLAEGPGIPARFYGAASEERQTLPEVRRELRLNPPAEHPSAGVVCIGVRQPLVAFNVNVRGTLDEAKEIARSIRSPGVRALAFDLRSRGLVQISMNLVETLLVGPKDAFDQVAAHTDAIVDCEVVGLVPEGIALEGLPLRHPVRSIEEALSVAEP
jgi:glutamate formiminotransferase